MACVVIPDDLEEEAVHKRARISVSDSESAADVLCLTPDLVLAERVANRIAIDAALAADRAEDDGDEVLCVSSDAALAAALATPAPSHRPDSNDDAEIAAVEAQKEADKAGLVAKAFKCPCCMEQVEPLEGVYMSLPANGNCSHMMCVICFRRYASGQIEKKELCRCPICPAAGAHVVPGWIIGQVLGPEAAHANDENEQIHLNQVDGGQISLWHCPTPDCTNQHLLPDGWDRTAIPDDARLLHCEGCGKRICIRCEAEDHVGFSCEQFVEWRKANASAETSYAELLNSGLIKPCPNCAAPILKAAGCNFMTCSSCKCKNGMCWQTGKARWGPKGCGGGHQCH